MHAFARFLDAYEIPERVEWLSLREDHGFVLGTATLRNLEALTICSLTLTFLLGEVLFSFWEHRQDDQCFYYFSFYYFG